jgi:hypothetical protein
MKKIVSISLITSSLLLVGCAGKNFNWENASTVKLGDTGAEVNKKMGGKPYTVSASTVNGKVVEKYIWVFANGMTGSTKSVSFILTDGKVTGIPTITQSIKNQ